MQSYRTESPSSLTQIIYKVSTIGQHQLYGLGVTSCGLSMLFWGLYTLSFSSDIFNFAILLCLVCVGSIPATTSALSKITSFTFSISSVVAIASIPSFGAGPAVVLASSAHFFLWFFKPKDPHIWKKTWTQFGFNSAMDGIAMGVAGLLYATLLNVVGNGLFEVPLIWFISVASFVLTNLGILYIMVRLQFGAKMTIHSFVANIGWSIGLGYLVHALGGGFLAYAMTQYNTQGIIIFFLPIFLSAFAFQLYAREMQSHMDNLEEIVAERTKEIAQLSDEKDALLAVLTHDMGSPLNTIKLTMGMIQRKPAIMAERPDLADRIVRSQTMLQQLVSNIVDLGRMETGNPIEIKKENLNLFKLVQDIVEELSTRAQLESIQLGIDESAEAVTIMADSYQIHRVLTNLVTNAIKYTPKNGEINIFVSQNDGMAEVTIKDSGYGIPEDELLTIFEPYQRVSANADKARGAGLGLSITKAIIEAHDGIIHVESEFNIGSTFLVQLPLDNGAKNATRS